MQIKPNNRQIKRMILEYSADLVNLTEVNKEWRNVPYDNTVLGATTGWNENRRIQVDQNTTQPDDYSEH